MRDLIILFVHLVSTLVRLFEPGGLRSVVAETLLLKHQLLILNRSRERAPNLKSSDRIVVRLDASVPDSSCGRRAETFDDPGFPSHAVETEVSFVVFAEASPSDGTERTVEGIVRLGGILAEWRDEDASLPILPTPVSARDHQPRRVALPPVLRELPGCRGSARRAGY